MSSRLLSLAALSLFLPGSAQAGGVDPVSEALSTNQAVPPVVIFVIDRSSLMSSACYSSSSTTCLADAIDIVKQTSRHYNEIKFGVVATADSASDSDFYEVAPAGSTYDQIATALSTLSAASGTTRNLAETIDSVSSDYLAISSASEDWEDDDGDGFDGDWGETPFSYYCSTVHVIVLTGGIPYDDEDPSGAAGSAAPLSDVMCNSTGYVATNVLDTTCRYDNVATHVYNTDHSSLTGTQRMVVSTVSMGVDTSTTMGAIADALFQSAADNTDSDGIYHLTEPTDSKDDALSGTLGILTDLMSGTYARSNPVIADDGSYLLSTYYEITGDVPLAKGHVLAYEIDIDPTSSTYGDILYRSGSPYDDYLGALWDGGWLLYSRIANTGEANNDDMDGFMERDVFFYDTTFATYMVGDAAYRRLSFDNEFVSVVQSQPSLLTTVLDSGNTAHDLDRSGTVDYLDVQELVDFTRGVSDSRFRYLDVDHGAWKLQDSPYSAPVVVNARSDIYSNSTSYRTFLDLLETDAGPDLVLLAANDGLLHAFALSDDEDTPTDDESGEELWAWVPDTLIMRDRGNAWGNGLIDPMLYGRSYLFDGTPVVEDVWIDADGDRVKDCGTTLDDCEWRRVVVVQQGFGGSRTLALDITETKYPKFLWEHTNTADATAMGYTTSRPAIFNVYDTSDSAQPTDRWVALWGGGRAADYSDSSTNYYKSVEGNLYMWAISDDFEETSPQFSDAGENVGTDHPDYAAHSASLDLDSDGKLEYTYISAPPTVVDTNSDGDGDVAYFPVTLAYDPSGAVTTSANPGHSYIYKVLFNEEDPDDFDWCEFYDPVDGAENADGDTASGGSAVAYGSRPEIYYSITTSWLTGGSLGVYWGTGSPFQDNTDSTAGAFFFMMDPDPDSCSEAKALTCGAETGGFYQLEAGERLTSDPLVYAGVVYFSTYTPDTDVCTEGEGRLYGLNYEDCGPGLDTTGDGVADSSDDAYVAQSGFVSNIAVGPDGDVFYANGTDIVTMEPPGDPFGRTAMVGWMEMY